MSVANIVPTTAVLNNRQVFLGGPFEALLRPGTGMAETDQQVYRDLITAFEAAGSRVFSAHRSESWGRKLLSPNECTPIALDEARRCDVFVAIPGDPASLGTHVEIGWASALGKPLVLLTGPDGAKCALVKGIGSVTQVEWVVVDPFRIDVTAVVEAAGRCLSRHLEAVTNH